MRRPDSAVVARWVFLPAAGAVIVLFLLLTWFTAEAIENGIEDRDRQLDQSESDQVTADDDNTTHTTASAINFDVRQSGACSEVDVSDDAGAPRPDSEVSANVAITVCWATGSDQLRLDKQALLDATEEPNVIQAEGRQVALVKAIESSEHRVIFASTLQPNAHDDGVDVRNVTASAVPSQSSAVVPERWFMLWLLLSSVATGVLTWYGSSRARTPAQVAEAGIHSWDRQPIEPVANADNADTALPVTAPAVLLGQQISSDVSGLAVDRGAAGAFEVYAATQVGLQHSTYGRVREDSYAIGSWCDENWAFLAVADGLGSSACAHIASRLATKSAIRELRESFPGRGRVEIGRAEWYKYSASLVRTVARELQNQPIDQLSSQAGHLSATECEKPNKTPSCTLTVAVLGPEIDGRFPAYWVTVGDSDLAFVDGVTYSVEWTKKNRNKEGAVISNDTHALPVDANQAVPGSSWCPSQTMVLLMTDGMADGFRVSPKGFAQNLSTCVETRPHENVFAELVNFEMPGANDDRTLVATWLRTRGPEDPLRGPR